MHVCVICVCLAFLYEMYFYEIDAEMKSCGRPALTARCFGLE